MKQIDIEKAMPILEREVKNYQVPVVDLIKAQTNEPWKVLVATILSARTKDETTAAAVTRLFPICKNLHGLRDLSVEDIAKIIHPVGFFKNKAKYLQALPDAVDTLFNGEIPDTVEELVKLPGVGRKTANLVVAVAFNKPAICVDTHVHRIMNIWKYVKTKTPLDTEMALRKKLPAKFWIPVNRVLVAFGQSICRPISPMCSVCPLNDICPKNGVTPRKEENSKVQEKLTMKGLKLMSWNVNGIRALEKKGFVDIILKESPDVIGIQETKAQEEQLSDAIKNIDGYKSYWFSAKRRGYSGVAVYSKVEPISVVNGLDNEEFDKEGRTITLEFDNYYFVNCYYPNAQAELARIDYKQGFNAAILAHCDELRKTKTVVLCGDYNVAHKAIDLANPKRNEMNPGYSIQERDDMDKFIAAGYIDTFRMFCPEPEQYSWWSYRFKAREKNIGWRIDYFCVNEDARERVLDADIRQDIMGSDHCPITMWLAK